MKKLYAFLLMGAFCFSCSETPDDPTCDIPDKDEEQNQEENPDEKPEETYIDITNKLCDGSRFIDREYEEYSSPLLGVYKAVPKQKEYSFSKDGNGSVTTYIAENTPRGYTQDVTAFTWSATNQKPVELRISLADGETVKLENVSIEENLLSFTGDTWCKELSVTSVWESQEIISYSVDFFAYPTTASVPPYMIALELSPACLTVTTEEGQATFITSIYGINPSVTGMPCYSTDGFSLTYYGNNIYACVDTKTAQYPYSFFEIITETEDMPFSKDGKMYFYIGKFDRKTKQFSLIESNKTYQPEN